MRLEKQKAETIVKLQEVEATIRSLEQAVMAKQGPLATCQTRIQQRRLRPGAEFCHDEVSKEDDLTRAKHLTPVPLARLTTPCCTSRGTSWTSSTSWRPAWDRWVAPSDSLKSENLQSESFPNSRSSSYCHPVPAPCTSKRW